MSVIGAPAGLLEDFQALGDKKNGHIGIVLVHGFTGSPAAMRPWAEYLNARGYSVRVPLYAVEIKYKLFTAIVPEGAIPIKSV